MLKLWKDLFIVFSFFIIIFALYLLNQNETEECENAAKTNPEIALKCYKKICNVYWSYILFNKLRERHTWLCVDKASFWNKDDSNKKLINVPFSAEAESYAQKQCERFEWKCKNNECIAQDELCDGQKDCTDGSDETAAECVHVRCPSYAFRCAYGACVNGDAECNGKKDCADNSDESSGKCPGMPTNNVVISGNCSNDDYQCESGECVPLYNACDGEKHCRDGSDETLKLCASHSCPSFAFRCGYGACISGSLKCNGINDCQDGSDESAVLCGRTGEIGTTNIITNKPSGIGTTRRTTTPAPTSGGCRVGFDQPNLIYVYDSDHNDVIRHGETVEVGTTIAYKCNPKYFLREDKVNFCEENGRWSQSHPTCIKYCSNEPLKRISIQATCNLNGRTISCDQPLEVGTKASISCSFFYYKPKDRVVQDVLVCDSDGEWDFHPYRCEQSCGIAAQLPKPFLTGSDAINNTLVPWHVSIFSSRKSRGYEQICGGSIINAKVVISAAHCFWDLQSNRRHPISYFRIAAGKYYRDYDAPEPLPVQTFAVEDIHIKPGYKDVLANYLNDLSVVILKEPIIFTTYIYPICIEWQSYESQYIKSNIEGRIAGWGKTEDGKSSDVLRAADLPTLSYSDCIEQTDLKYRDLVTGDKFCVLTRNGIGVCPGDSGGGFAIPKIVNGVKTYFLWGIVSNGLTGSDNCTENLLTAFTNIQLFKDIITTYESNNRPK